MNRKTHLTRTATLIALLLVPLGQSAAASDESVEEELLGLYRCSPLLAHRSLRRLIHAGQDCRERIASFETATGDRSFESLKLSPGLLQPALRLRQRAATLWESGRPAEAADLFTRAEKEFERIGANSEAVFCLYFRAELLAQDERFAECLRLTARGLETSRRRGYAYLSALLHQSVGFAQWFQDRLPESAESFGRALEVWSRIPYEDGIVASWSNLALLYDELGLPDRASDCYLEALAGLRRNSEREIRGQLLLNFALFSFRSGDDGRALRFLELARHYADLAPDDFALADAELHGDPSKLPRGAQGSTGIQRRILEAVQLAETDAVSAGHLLRRALDEARRLGLRLYERRAALELGALLDRQSRFKEAERHYRQAIDREQFLLNVDAAFPFRRAVSPFFDGWVRALIELGEYREARQAIHWFSRLRLLKIDTLLSGERRRPAETDRRGSLDAVSANAVWAPLRLPDLPVGPTPPPNLRPDMAVVELWPDADRVYAWIDSGSRRDDFLRLQCGVEIAPLVRALDRSLRDAASSLPPPPARSLLDELARSLLRPLESRLGASRRLLLIPHKELQQLPFELLTLQDGTLVSDRWITSYLPLPDRRFTTSIPVPDPPLVLYSQDLLARESARGELESLGRFTPAPVVRELDRGSNGWRGRWIHVAGHLRLDERFWYLSRLGGATPGVGLIDFLESPLECELLVLATCDGARAGDLAFPYWMGASELLLARGAQSLVISRWQLDERSIPLLLEMYRLLDGGTPVDEALAAARRRFRKTDRRDFPAEHPLFWAGIIHVGWPGGELSSGSSEDAPHTDTIVFLLVVALGLWCSTRRGLRKTPKI